MNYFSIYLYPMEAVLILVVIIFTACIIIHKLNKINFKLKKMATKLETIQALLVGINESTNNIAADIERIAGGLSGGLTATEADGVIAELQAAADKLKAVADVTPETDI